MWNYFSLNNLKNSTPTILCAQYSIIWVFNKSCNDFLSFQFKVDYSNAFYVNFINLFNNAVSNTFVLNITLIAYILYKLILNHSLLTKLHHSKVLCYFAILLASCDLGSICNLIAEFCYSTNETLQTYNTALVNNLVIFHPALVQFVYVTFLIMLLSSLVFYIFFSLKTLKPLTIQMIWIVKGFKKTSFVAAYLTFLLGSWWALQELNWNNWWNWDFIELVSFVFLVLSIYLVHIFKIQQTYVVINEVLYNTSLITFCFFIFVRSNIFVSLHAFNFFEFFNFFFVVFWVVFYTIIISVLIKFVLLSKLLLNFNCNFWNETYLILKKISFFILASVLSYCFIIVLSSTEILNVRFNISSLFFYKYFLKLNLIVLIFFFYLNKKHTYPFILFINNLLILFLTSTILYWIRKLTNQSYVVASHLMFIIYFITLELNWKNTPTYLNFYNGYYANTIKHEYEYLEIKLSKVLKLICNDAFKFILHQNYTVNTKVKEIFMFTCLLNLNNDHVLYNEYAHSTSYRLLIKNTIDDFYYISVWFYNVSIAYLWANFFLFILILKKKIKKKIWH